MLAARGIVEIHRHAPYQSRIARGDILARRSADAGGAEGSAVEEQLDVRDLLVACHPAADLCAVAVQRRGAIPVDPAGHLTAGTPGLQSAQRADDIDERSDLERVVL